MPSASLISWWVYPSTSCITNTIRYLSGSASIAPRSFTFRSGSACLGLPPTDPATPNPTSHCRSRFTFLSPFRITLTAIDRSQVESAASPRNWSIFSNARMNASCVKSRASSSSPVIRCANR